MRAITVKNIPDNLYQRLKQSATENRRSINSEILVCIERTVQTQKHESVNDILTRARQTREKTKGLVLTDRKFNEMKTAGRP
jgi:plasmid stability protein